MHIWVIIEKLKYGKQFWILRILTTKRWFNQCQIRNWRRNAHQTGCNIQFWNVFVNNINFGFEDDAWPTTARAKRQEYAQLPQRHSPRLFGQRYPSVQSSSKQRPLYEGKLKESNIYQNTKTFDCFRWLRATMRPTTSQFPRFWASTRRNSGPSTRMKSKGHP